MTMKDISKTKYLETCLVISTGFVLLWFIYETKILLHVAFVIGIFGIFIPPAAKGITWFWFKLADVLGAIIPKIVLVLVFFIFLFPVAFLYRLFNKRPLDLKKKPEGGSYWNTRNYTYGKKDLINPW